MEVGPSRAARPVRIAGAAAELLAAPGERTANFGRAGGDQDLRESAAAVRRGGLGNRTGKGAGNRAITAPFRPPPQIEVCPRLLGNEECPHYRLVSAFSRACDSAYTLLAWITPFGGRCTCA